MQDITFKLNGATRRVVADPARSLLDVLRRDLGLTGAKEGCGRGHCGTCAVLVDNEVRLACQTPVIKARGREVVTIEGLGTVSDPHPLQVAFARTGAIQCGFCTPGMIIRAKALIDREPRPDRAAIVKALQPHLCRCTGYQKIFEAVELAAARLRGEVGPIELRTEGEDTLGRAVVRPDALDKATGATVFAADLKVDECAHVALVRSPHHHARIVSIDVAPALAGPGVLAVLTADDVAGTNILKMAGDDQPILCGDKVRFIGDPVAAAVAASERLAGEAAERVRVEYEPLPPLLTVAESLEPGAPRVHEDRPNLMFEQPIVHNEIERGLAEAEVIVEREYSTQAVEHAYLEPDAGVAYLDDRGRLVVMSGSQNIHQHQKTIAGALGLGLDQVRVIQTPMGGGFGGKLDVSVGGVLGLAAWKLGRPVRMRYSRPETFIATTKRHPFTMRVKVGAKKDGTLTALDMDVLADAGAYASFSKSVVTRGIVHAGGPYQWPHARVRGRAVYTTTAVKGAMRGFGAPQTAFAVESILDELAAELGLDPLEIRARNGFVPGDVTIFGQRLDDASGLAECFEKMRPLYRRAVKEARASNTPEVRRGVGLAAVWFGPGRSAPDKSEAWAELRPDDDLQVWIGAADMGQGSDTMFWQIAARTMGYPLDRVHLCTTDTAHTPDGNFSAGSRQTYVSGKAVQLAVAELKKAMDQNRIATYGEMRDRGLPTLY
ncbi:MAG: molybdopterin-dependent oxidoreductase, partial [Proteobacteria bacterium]|nr:molybdopterin-dependent oxidoreductase [Pseudomonadota bacterium]